MSAKTFGEQLREWGRAILCVESSTSEIPLSTAILSAYVKRTWELLGTAGEQGAPLRIAICGAGLHTEWLYEVVRHLPGRHPVVVAVIDDNPDLSRRFWALTPIRAEQFDPTTAELILLSSDTVAEKMKTRCRTLYGDKIRTLNLYEGLPPGPYFKQLDPFPAVPPGKPLESAQI